MESRAGRRRNLTVSCENDRPVRPACTTDPRVKDHLAIYFAGLTGRCSAANPRLSDSPHLVDIPDRADSRRFFRIDFQNEATRTKITDRAEHTSVVVHAETETGSARRLIQLEQTRA